MALGGNVDDWTRLEESWGELFAERMAAVAEGGTLSLHIRMLGGSHVGYARTTRRWWAPVRAELAAQAPVDGPLYFISSNSHSIVNIATAVAREREAALVAYVESLPETDILSEELRAFPRGRDRRLVGELPVLRRARLLGGPRAGGSRRAGGGRACGGRDPPALDHGAARARAGHPAGAPRAGRAGPTAGRGRRGGPGRVARHGRQHRLPAGRGGLQHPARDRRRHVGPARRLRARQGGDAQRRRRRRDALERHPRRAHEDDVLARQRVRHR